MMLTAAECSPPPNSSRSPASAAPPAKPPRRTLVYPVLLDDGYMAQVVIPFDLSAAECQRMTAFLAALVVPWRV